MLFKLLIIKKQIVEHAPLAAFFTTPHPSLRICARLHCRVFEQHRCSPPGKNDSYWRGSYLGEI